MSEGDLAHALSASRVSGFTDGMVWDPPERVEDLHEHYRNAYAAWAAGTSYSFTVEGRDGEFLGRCSIRSTKVPGVWDLGFWTHPTFQGRGFMSEVVGAVMAFGFGVLDAVEIEAGYARWNAASRRVLEKNAMVWRENVPQGFMKHGAWVAVERWSKRCVD